MPADQNAPRRSRHLLTASVLMTALGLGLLGVEVARPSSTHASTTATTAELASFDPAAGSAVLASAQTSNAPTPRWRTARVFRDNRMLIAYYGTAGTGALGVLGETGPVRAHQRLTKVAAQWRRPDQPVKEVFELIASIADAHPGPDGDFSHDIDHDAVRRYVDVARRRGAYIVLDLQTGRSDFLRVAKRWEWALRQPHVGLALDPEWRMKPGQVPGHVIGSVRAAEVNRVSAWLSRIVVARNLPQKVFMLHQFRIDMLPDIGGIVRRDGLAMVQHVDGFGTPGQKLDTYRAVVRPRQFAPGYKLFYDEDRPMQGPAPVLRIRPRVRFVSYQ